MSKSIDIERIIALVQEQYPDRKDLILALRNGKGGHWTSNDYFRFVDATDANEPGAEWQHDECIVLEQKDRGDIVIDLLKDGRVGGLEFIDNAD